MYTYSGWSDKCELGDGWLEQKKLKQKYFHVYFQWVERQM